MNFGEALELLKNGFRVSRVGWNGKDMYLYLLTEFSVLGNGHSSGVRFYQPCIVMKTAQGLHQPGWLASQADMLAEDWIEVDG